VRLHRPESSQLQPHTLNTTHTCVKWPPRFTACSREGGCSRSRQEVGGLAYSAANKAGGGEGIEPAPSLKGSVPPAAEVQQGSQQAHTQAGQDIQVANYNIHLKDKCRCMHLLCPFQTYACSAIDWYLVWKTVAGGRDVTASEAFPLPSTHLHAARVHVRAADHVDHQVVALRGEGLRCRAVLKAARAMQAGGGPMRLCC